MYTNLFSTKTAVSLHSARSILAAFLTLSFLIAPLASYAAGGGDGGGGGGGAGVTCTFTGDVSSDWAVAGNWSCGHVPTGSDFVVIPNTETAESSALGAVGTTLEIQMGGSLTVSGGTLTIGNTITNAGLFTSTGGTTTASTGGITNSGGMALNGGTLSSGLNSFTNSGTINGSGAGAILEAGLLGNLPGGIINHTGGWQIRAGSGGFTNMGTYNSTADDSIFRFTGSGSAVPTAVTYPNLEFGGSISPSDNSRFVAHGNIALLTGLIFTANSSTFVLSGNWTAEAATAISNNHTTVEFTGSATSTLTADPGGASFFDIKVNKDVVDKGVMLLSNATATHALVLTQGLFDYNSYTLTLPQSCIFTGGTTAWETPSNWDCAGVPRLPNETDTVTIPGGQSPVMSMIIAYVGSLTIETSATLEVQAGASLSVYGTSTNAGTITINSIGGVSAGVIGLEGGRYSTSTNSGLIQVLNGGTLSAYVPLVNLGTIDASASGNLILGENMNTVGDLDVSGLGTLTLAGSGDLTFPPHRFTPAVSSIGTLTISITNPERISLAASVTTTHALNLNNGYLDLNGNTLSLDGAASLMVGASGGFYGGGTLEFTGSGDQTIGAPISTTISSMRIRKTSGQVSQGTSVISVADAFDVVSGTYLIDGGAFTTNGSFTIYAVATVSSTVSSNLNSLAGLTNAGTVYIDGNNYTAGGIINNGTIYLGSSLSMTVDTLTNNGSIVGEAGGGTLTLNTAFTKGDGSTFSAPQTVIFAGPAAMPAYSYHNVTINNDITLSSDADTLTFGGVGLAMGLPGPTWTIQNTGSARSDVRIVLDSLSILSGASAVFSGTLVGPTVTTTGALTNNGTLTLSDASLSLGGLAVDGMGDPVPALTGSGEYTFTNSDLRIFGGVAETIPIAVYQDLSLLGSGAYTLSASTTVMATTTIASSATLDLSTYRLNAIGDISNAGLITSSTGAVLHHPTDYIRFSDSLGSVVSSLTDGDALYITVKDQSRNLNGSTIETILASATSTAPAGSDSETLTLSETSASSGIFRNTSAITVNGAAAVTAANGTFEIIGNGEGHTAYIDAFDDSDTSSTLVAVTYTQPAAEAEAAPANTGGGAVSASGGALAYIPQTLPLRPVTTTTALVPIEVTFLDNVADTRPVPQTDTTPTPNTPPSVQSVDTAKNDAKAFGVTLSAEDAARVASFIENGSSKETVALGSGERRALLRDAYDTLGKAPSNADLERLARGEIAKARNMDKERAQLPRVRSTFRTIYGRDPNFKNAEENLAWNTLMYRIRFPRDLTLEAQGIKEFRATFNRTPSDPFQWAAVRVLGYVNR